MDRRVQERVDVVGCGVLEAKSTFKKVNGSKLKYF